ncbi:MAG: hypothetical protein PHR68_03850 [Candidatus Gracilibacteria bacterium]|nr:hypothetical protein [Candidatus Gracilibacteria bacterium]
MNKSKKATSIVEVLVIMLIIIIGVIGMYNIFSKGQTLSNTTANRIQAIGMAREGLEAMINIRDTNYMLFSSSYSGCWNTINYNSDCVTGTPNSISAGSYKIYQNSDNKWYLSGGIAGNYSDINYRNFFKVGVDSNGLYTQSGGTDTKPLFTREIKISYPSVDKMNLTSLVQWSDSSKNGILKVELSTIITNFKNKN